MVKLTGPLQSQRASGTIAKTVTFSNWKGKAYARHKVIPSDPVTIPQRAMRAMFSFLSQQWNGLQTATKNSWQPLATQLNTSPFNAYLKTNQANWSNLLAPGKHATLERDDLASTGLILAAAYLNSQAQIDFGVFALHKGWGVCIFASATDPCVPSPTNLAIVQVTASTGAHVALWTPPTRTTWYLNTRFFSEEGTLAPQDFQTTLSP